MNTPPISLNRRHAIRMVCGCCSAGLTLPALGDTEKDGSPQLLELGVSPMTRIAKTVWVARIAPKLWLHTTTDLIPGGFYYPANGLILERPEGALLIDTGYRPDQAEDLLIWSAKNLPRPISVAVATHFHNDRTGGIPALQKHTIPVLAHPLTCRLCRDHDMPIPAPIKEFDTERHKLGKLCELCFPGPGHTPDNIVAWLPEQNVLFGGCMIKSTTSTGLGNIADSVVDRWAASVERGRDLYPTAKTIVPGHGTVVGDSIKQTLMLLATAGQH